MASVSDSVSSGGIGDKAELPVHVLFRITVSKNCECNVIFDINGTAHERSSGGIQVDVIDKTSLADDEDDDEEEDDEDENEDGRFGPEIGSVEAYLLRRGGHGWNFHEVCDIISSEIQSMGVSFFDHRGKIRGPVNEAITNKAACETGGVLYISAVRVNESRRGKNIGLHFMKAVMDAVVGQWSLAVIFPAPEYNTGPIPFDEVVPRLSRYFARLGFIQVCGNRPHELNQYWIVEGVNYTGTILPKEAVAELVVNRLDFHKPTGVDQEIVEAFRQHGSSFGGLATMREKIQSAIARGGSVDRANCITYAAANGANEVIRMLVTEFGAQVDGKDSAGQTALMLAAYTQKAETVRLLLSLGADITMTNNEGEDAIAFLRKAMRSSTDFMRTFGLDSRLADQHNHGSTCMDILKAAKTQKTGTASGSGSKKRKA